VAGLFDKVDGFDATGSPTATDIEAKIRQRSAEIDRRTNHAFRENRVVDALRDLRGPYTWFAGIAVPLGKREVRSPFDSAKGDKLEVWRGNEWSDWVADPSYVQGRDEDYWIDAPAGILWIRDRYVFNRHPQLRLTYRYGHPTVPEDVKMACAKLVAADLLESEQFTMSVSGSGEPAVDARTTTKRWRADADRVIQARAEVEYLAPY
jgi:hypothetical protein